MMVHTLKSTTSNLAQRAGLALALACAPAGSGCGDDDKSDDDGNTGSTDAGVDSGAADTGTGETNPDGGLDSGTTDDGPQPSALGVSFPEGFEDWAPVGMSRRLDNGQIRLVVGNKAAVDAARAALPGRPDEWPEGSVLVDIVWPEVDNPNWEEMQGPGDFAAIAVMEKDSARFAETGNWGYGFWNAMLESAGNLGDASTGADTTTCFGCHNTRVPDQDFVFTQPLPFPADDLVASAEEAPNGSQLPAGVTRWRFLAAHHRTDNGQLRLVLGNDTAVDAFRAGSVSPKWPDGSMIADIFFASETLEATDTPNETNMVAPTTWAALALMERDPQKHADTGEWGYTVFTESEGALSSTSSTAADENEMGTCYGCHNAVVPDLDFVFTVPGGLPANLP